MRELVGDDLGAGATLIHRRGRRIDEDEVVAERDGAGVLHAAPGEVGHRDDVELAERVADAEVGLERRDELLRARERFLHGHAFALHGDGAQGHWHGAHRVGRDFTSVDDVEIADREGHEVSGQLLGDLEVRGLQRAVFLLTVDGGVGHGHVLTARGERDVEGRLEARLVEAREHQARRDRLELGEGVALVTGADGVEALEVAAVACLVAERERDLLGLDGLGERQVCHALAVELAITDGHHLAVGELDRGACNPEAPAVQPQVVERFVELHDDAHIARESVAVGVDSELEGVALGRRVGG